MSRAERMTQPLRPDLPRVHVETRHAWRQWLERNADTSSGVWAVTTKKAHLAPGQDLVSAGPERRVSVLRLGRLETRPGR